MTRWQGLLVVSYLLLVAGFASCWRQPDREARGVGAAEDHRTAAFIPAASSAASQASEHLAETGGRKAHDDPAEDGDLSVAGERQG